MTNEDWSVGVNGVAKTHMIVTHADGSDGTVFVSRTENSHIIRVLNVRRDGSKCEFLCTEYDLRAARVAINLFIEALDSWKKPEKKEE